MRVFRCDVRTAKLTVFTAFVFIGTFCLLSASTLTFGDQSASTNVPELDSRPYIEVITPEDPIWPYRVFKSSSWTPPNITITRNEGGLADGYLLLTAKSRGKPPGLAQSAPWIFTDDNELVYAHNDSHGSNNLRIQEYEGKPHLTVWLGKSTIGHGYGEFVIMDQEYQQVHTGLKADIKMNMGNEDSPGLLDFHEQELSSRGTVYVTAYNDTRTDLTVIGGEKDGWLVNSLIYEFNITTGQVLFSWSALDHIPLEASHLELQSYMGKGIEGKGWDHFHLNSIQEVGDYLLINSRHTFSVYLISRKTGDIEWELSGRGEGGDFGPLGEEGQFSWQHHARAHNVTAESMVISLFDNHYMEELNETTPTRGLLLQLSLPPDASTPPTVLRTIHGDEEFHSGSQGSYIPDLPNGNQLICYGPVPVVHEYGPEGELRWEGRFGHDEKAQSYRAFKEEWHATPKDWDPSLFVETVEQSKRHDHDEEEQEEEVELYVSWNGATEVDSWNVYTKKEGEDELMKAGRAKKMGFETVVRIKGGGGMCVVVGAVEGMREVRRSNEVCIYD